MTDNGEIHIGGEPTPKYDSPSKRAIKATADANPGVWISCITKTTASTPYKNAGYEATTRRNPDGTLTLWIRKPIPTTTPKADS